MEIPNQDSKHMNFIALIILIFFDVLTEFWNCIETLLESVWLKNDKTLDCINFQAFN